jgi:hypothetical protein
LKAFKGTLRMLYHILHHISTLSFQSDCPGSEKGINLTVQKLTVNLNTLAGFQQAHLLAE